MADPALNEHEDDEIVETPETSDDEFAKAFAEATRKDEVDDTVEQEEQEEQEDDDREEVEAKADDQPTEEEQEDLLAGLDDEHRELFNAIMKEREEWEHRARSDAGRVHALQAQVNSLREIAEASGSSAGDLSTKELASVLKDRKKFNAFMEEYPELGEAFMDALEGLYGAVRTDVGSLVQPLAEREYQNEIAAAKAAVEERFPGWEDTVKTPEFIDWLRGQPENVVNLIYSDSAADTAALLGYYTGTTGQSRSPSTGDDEVQQQLQAEKQQQLREIKERRRRQLESSEEIPRRGASPRPGQANDFTSAFNEAVLKIQRERQQFR